MPRPPLAVRARRWAGYTAMTGVLALERARGDALAASFFADGRQDPYSYAEQVRRRGRLIDSAMGWASADYEVTSEVLREHRRFGSADIPVDHQPVAARVLTTLLWDTPAAGQGTVPKQGSYASTLPPDALSGSSVIGMDPPEHTRLRRLVSRAFTPRSVERLRPTVEAIAHRLLDDAVRRARAGGEVDLVRDYAAPLPVAVIAALLGIPDEDLDRIFVWGEALGDSLDIPTPATQERSEAARVAIARYFATHIAARRREPGDLVIDTLIAATRAKDGPDAATDGEESPLSAAELDATASLLLTAGFETTVNLLGNTISALLLHPRQRALLHLSPELTANTVEESLRWDPPVQRELRRVRHDGEELAGVRLQRGDRVLMLLSGANRDPAVFSRPACFDITRENADRHLSFGAGVHHCLGAALSRLEGVVAMRSLLDRFPEFRATGPGIRARRLVLRGMTSIPVDLGPEAG